NGAVDATFRAIESIAESGSLLQLYSVSSITSGTDAQGEVGVRLERGGRIVNGHGADLDIVIASAKAYINALNKLYGTETPVHPQLARAV
ncbi:MAG: 2-isopropylmalate synthase, partial [Gammaproteobacteria bacterium]|nr:2-isopropylmalate synthase [Gammaproteobacteria bacterium]